MGDRFASRGAWLLVFWSVLAALRDLPSEDINKTGGGSIYRYLSAQPS